MGGRQAEIVWGRGEGGKGRKSRAANSYNCNQTKICLRRGAPDLKHFFFYTHTASCFTCEYMACYMHRPTTMHFTVTSNEQFGNQIMIVMAMLGPEQQEQHQDRSNNKKRTKEMEDGRERERITWNIRAYRNWNDTPASFSCRVRQFFILFCVAFPSLFLTRPQRASNTYPKCLVTLCIGNSVFYLSSPLSLALSVSITANELPCMLVALWMV